jgi:phospholipid/cholesterol/gamma-HCH transport system substrate-binding protein
VTAIFDDAGDLQSRGSVQVADVRVGSIGRIKLTKDFRAQVSLNLNKGVRVPKDSKAYLRTTSLLGEKFVELRPNGDPAAAPYLREGDQLAQSGEAPELEFVAEQAVTVLGAVTESDVATLVDTGAVAFGGRGPELKALIGDLSSISATLASRTTEITRIIDHLGAASATLAANKDDVATLLTNLAQATTVLSDNRQRAVDALASLSRLARVQNTILDKYRDDVDRQIKQVDGILGAAAAQSAEVGNLIDWLNKFALGLPKAVPNDFTQVYMWLVPAQQDPRVGK